jgi:hypothetical protein
MRADIRNFYSEGFIWRFECNWKHQCRVSDVLNESAIFETKL